MKHNFCNETILIVDDEEDIREIIGSYFRRTGAKILTASNGREAFEILESTPVDAVISDVCMPDVDGKELLQMISRSRFATIPFFIISGNDHFDEVENANKEITGRFEKPFCFDEIDAVVGRALGLEK